MLRKRVRAASILLLAASMIAVTGPCSVSVRATESESLSSSGSEDKGQEPLVFTAAAKTLKAGKTKIFKTSLPGVTFSSSKPKIAGISKSGKVKALRCGKTVITAAIGSERVSVTLKVTPKKVIGIDPGHQQTGDSGLEPIGPGASEKKAKVAGGATGAATGLPEYKLTLAVGKELRKVLKSRGYRVVMTRTKHNVHISNNQRAKKLNKSCDIAVRLHGDSWSASSRGASVLYPSSHNTYVGDLSGKCKKLSKYIIKSYCKKTDIPDRGLSVRDDLTGTNWSTIPVTLIEMGFMSNPTEDRYMAKKSNQKIMAKGIADGIDDYFEY